MRSRALVNVLSLMREKGEATGRQKYFGSIFIL